MQFERGLATAWDGGRPEINTWIHFAGKAIPNGEVVLWPPHELQPEYARHQVPAADFQRLFEHLADSGYALEWFDGYSVDGKPFYNFVWRPATTEWRAFFGQTAEAYQSRLTQATADGLAPVLVESYVDDEAKAEGLSPINVSVISLHGQRFYTVLYRQTDLGAWQVTSRLDAEAYQQTATENLRAGRKPFYLSAYLHEDKHYYSAIFAENPVGIVRAHHGLTADEYQSTREDTRQEGFLTCVVTGMHGANSKHLFAAVWRK
jgi:hypothetical protein